MARLDGKSAPRSRGFTLVELVISMVLAAILAGFVAMMIGTPVDIYLAQSRRAELSDSAETAMRSLREDVRKALPDSLRPANINGSPVLDMIEVLAVANYRTDWTTGEPLQVGSPDQVFDAVTAITVASPIRYLAVGHSNDNGSDVYAPTTISGVITPAMNITLNGTGTQVTLPAPFQFTTKLPTQRAYLLGGVTRYQCDSATRELRRSRDSAISAAPSAVVAPYDVIARNVAACSFRVRNGKAEHGGIAIVEITISRATNGNTETLHMFRQLKVENIS